MRKAFNEKEIEELTEVSDANPIKDGQTNLDKPQNESPMQSDDASVKRSDKVLIAVKSFFTPLRMTYIALFTAIAYILYLPWFEFSIFPAVPFLKIDFSNAFVLIAGFSLGPVSAIIVGVLKEILHGLTFSQTVGIGELANILMMLPYVLIPSIVYKKYKGIKTVILLLVIACVAQTFFSFPINYTITFPFFLTFSGKTWLEGMNFYLGVWYWAVLFNLVKTILLSIAVFLIYKPLSKLIKYTNKRFSKKKKVEEKTEKKPSNPETPKE